jgi:calcineurin-like phosphoesterase family protein
MSVFYTSDHHFGHRLVAGLRGFETVAHHDEFLIAEWEKRVHKEDHVWVLGDLCVSNPNAALEIVDSLPGVKHLISGNHDAVHPMHRNAHKWQRRYLEVFESVQPFARRRISGLDVLLSHFPYERDRGAARYTQYRLPDNGAWLLHGHTHGTERLVLDENGTGREIHVGLDAWDFAPVPQSTIEGLIYEG